MLYFYIICLFILANVTQILENQTIKHRYNGTELYIYIFLVISAVWLFVPGGIIHPVVSISALIWFIRSFFFL